MHLSPAAVPQARELADTKAVAFNGGSAGVLRANLVTTTGSRSVEQGPITFAGINMGLILVVVHELLGIPKKS